MNNSDLRYSTLFWFLCSNFVLSLFIGSSYLNFVPDSITFGEWAFSRLAYVSNFGLLFLVLAVPLYLLTSIIPSMLFMQIASSVVFLTFNIALFVDTIIYKLYRFHINGLVWNILVTEGSSDSVKVSTSTIVVFSIYLFLIIFSVIGTHYLLSRYIKQIRLKYSGKRLLSFLLLGFFCINLIDKPIYAHADLNNKTHITRYAKLFPLYQPLTVKRLAQQWGIDVNREYYPGRGSDVWMEIPLAKIKSKTGHSPGCVYRTSLIKNAEPIILTKHKEKSSTINLYPQVILVLVAKLHGAKLLDSPILIGGYREEGPMISNLTDLEGNHYLSLPSAFSQHIFFEELYQELLTAFKDSQFANELKFMIKDHSLSFYNNIDDAVSLHSSTLAHYLRVGSARNFLNPLMGTRYFFQFLFHKIKKIFVGK